MPIDPLPPQSAFFADFGGGGTTGVAGTDPTYGDGGNATPAGPAPSPLTFRNILGGRPCPTKLGVRACPNGGAPNPRPIPGVDGTDPAPNPPVVADPAPDPEANGGGGGAAGLVDA